MTASTRHHALFLATLCCLQALLPPTAGTCSITSSAVVSALLPLHSGNSCSSLQLRGLQQLAALRAVINEVNNEMKPQSGLTIGLQVQDTCASPDGAMRAALRSLVDTQQSCSNPPLYLGMIGPEDTESLAKVKGVSKVFNTTHILPNFLSHKESEDDSVFYVSIERIKEQAESVTALLKKLNWQSFSLAFEEPMAELAEVLVQSTKEDSTVCMKGTVTRLNSQSPVPNIFSGGQDGVVVLVDSHQMAAKILKSYQSLTTRVIMVVRTAGLEPWQVPRSATKLYLLQQISATTEDVPETMNATLRAEYETQKQNEYHNVHCNDIANTADCGVETSAEDNLLDSNDASVTPLANSIRLIVSALKSVHRARCLAGTSATYGMCPKLLALPAGEWRNALRRATASSKHPDNSKIRFLMELPTSFQVYTRDANVGNLVKVATIAGGDFKETTADFKFPAMNHTTAVASCGATPTIPAAPAHVPVLTTLDEGHVITLKEIYASEYSFYELLGMICGVGFIMLGIMATIIYVIYNSLVEKTEKESTGGSLETVRSVRPPRRNFKDTFRRNSSTRSSNHS